MRVTLIFLGIFFCFYSVKSETYRIPSNSLAELTTDRPDFTESTETVDRGWIQIETTIAQHSEDFDGLDGSTTSWNYGGSLLRYGLLKDWELRLGWAGYSIIRTFSETAEVPINFVEGQGDLNVGFKNKFTEQDGFKPNTAIIYYTSIPTGDRDISSETVEPGIKLGWSYDIIPNLAISGNFNFALLNPDVDTIDSSLGLPTTTSRNRHCQFQPTVSVSYSITEELGIFVEYFTSHNFHKSIPDEHFFDTGVTLLLFNNLQLDVFSNIGLTKASPDLTVGSGVSYRF
jgi:hypothetical protein